MTEERFVKIGDSIKLHFHGTLEDATVIDTSKDKEPLEFNVGKGEVIIGIDEAVIGMKEGQSKNIHISSDKAYGPKENELAIRINKNELPKDLELKIGHELQIPNEDGEPYRVRVSDMTENEIELDGNHPLAGKNLIFELTIDEIM